MSLQVRGPDFSVTKQKALEDAKKMQSAVDEEVAKAGQDKPPYLLNELIGKGSFGRVYKATDINTSMLVAVKIIDIEESDTVNPKLADTFKEFLAEVNALKLLSDSGAKNINHVIDALPVGQSMWMITEYCAGGSVATLMKPTAPGGLQEKWIIPILREVAEAVFWVHRQGIIHRDIKCANVLVTEAGGVQLCDFGVAGVIETKFDKRSTFIGTPHWMAPELFDQSTSYGTEVDIWAFGSMVYEIASGLPPNVMAGIDVYQLGNYIKAHTPRLEGDQYSDQLKDLVSYCLQEDPSKRPTIEDVQKHPYIANTAQKYPASSLALLVRGFKLWESQGGSRKSLFAPGGAQNVWDTDDSDFSSTAMANDEWNFSTTMAFDQQVFQNTDVQAVYDVYGSNVDFDPGFLDEMSRNKPKGGRRRPPPQALAAMKAPLEKVFDPNTISNYEDNSRAYYGRPVPPPASDLPLRDDSLQSMTVRESLIDLDASLNGSNLANFVDMNTIRAGAPRVSVDYHMGDEPDFNKPPLSDPADLNPNRRTQDWKFPSMAPPASANPEMSRFPFNEDRSGPNSASRPQMFHHQTDPVPAPNYGGDLTVPRSNSQMNNRESTGSLIDLDDLMVPQSNQNNRISTGSLIDLDMGLADPTPELTRPSTANSDVASVSGSEMGLANPFDLERHASLSIPKDDDLGLVDLNLAEPSGTVRPANGQAGLRLNTHQSFNSADYSDPEFLTPQQAAQPVFPGIPRSTNRGSVPLPLPPPPAPPSVEVMQGSASADAVKEELRRMAMSLGEHLSHANQYLSTLPVRKGGRQDLMGEMA
ncbi:serine threonine protein [Colletotrichum sp. SAR 10_70]|nr:serine threonine protein [Colletotrichum sp. SAR 10_71]KAI8172374.1 serine threonine protein [Colletotrichum sp. SAR 10_70]KAI8178868.1 serine threonine protein [Colletotrichum sp. SAR 10_65]KAI8182612.1 serine threonine protein [Colletotrichum sp. SAR 10_75]KAI8209398.1 serine threonine protein [Colletotrichum sp. SAR 10_76]KAI8230300.1 serine threonine protein [Colletotrichum sp. SAR 10_86]KAI8241862.1 serine threonine protein [Colletotrichum sp. SAR 10_96]KAI8252477.1 serine threonine 